ncbi:MAG: PDZ domain-containing protein [Opitutales bacterium]|nr:PDZ domain-containing protein [Opitutales bacterium]
MDIQLKHSFKRATRTVLLSLLLGLAVGIAPLAWSKPVDEDLSELPFTEAYLRTIDLLAENYPLGHWKEIDWETARNRYLPEIALAESNNDLQAFCRVFAQFAFNTIRDGHTWITVISEDAPVRQSFTDIVASERGGSFGLTLASLDNGKVVVASLRPGEPAELAGIQVGDEIITWNGTPIVDKLATIDLLWALQGTPTDEGAIQLANTFIGRGEPESYADLVVRNASDGIISGYRLEAIDDPLGHMFDIAELGSTAPGNSTFRFYWINGGVAYLGISSLVPDFPETGFESDDQMLAAGMEYVETFKDYMRSVTTAGGKELILDLRGNEGGADILGAMMVSCLTRDSWLYTQNVYQDDNGQWVNEDDPFAVSMVEPEGDPLFEGDILVLVDSNTVSAGEGFAYHLQKLPNARVIGTTRTNGSYAWVGSRIILPGGLVYSFPSGPALDESFQIMIDTNAKGEGGVYPDIRIPMSLNRVMREANGEDVELSYTVDELIQTRATRERINPTPVACPTILAFEVNGEFLPVDILRPASNGVSAEAIPTRIHLPIGAPTDIRTIWDWRKNPSSFTIIQGALPAGLSLNRETGHIAGSPQTAGVFEIQLSVKDWRGRGYQQLQIHVE